jgi:hypothetical protein
MSVFPMADVTTARFSPSPINYIRVKLPSWDG